MSLSPGYPHYPSPQPSERRPLSRLWLVAAIGFAVLSLVSIGLGAYILTTSFFRSFIDDPEILDVVERECDRMTDAVGDLTVTGSPKEQAAIILKQNAAAERMLEAIHILDEGLLAADHPTVEWLDDWDQFLKVRAAFAFEVERGELPELNVPLDPNGDEIINRMDWASEPECVVPEALLDPYPVEVSSV